MGRKTTKVTKNCEACGKPFSVHLADIRRGRGKFCSKSCATKTRTGKSANNWKGGKERTLCRQCGKDFLVHPSRKIYGHGMFCSRSCFYIFLNDSDEIKAKRRKTMQKKLLDPEYHKKLSDSVKRRWEDPHERIIMLEKSIKNIARATVSDKRLKMVGPNHPNWRGGISFEPYCPKFTERLKEKIRETFGRKCYICAKTEKENIKHLSVHHCDYNKGQGCGQKWSLLPLCHKCHIKTNINRWYWFNLLSNYWAMNKEINEGATGVLYP
jgi:hypothetical protein